MKILRLILSFAIMISITSCASDKLTQERGGRSEQEVLSGVITKIRRLGPQRPIQTEMQVESVSGVFRDDGAASVAGGAVFGTVVHFAGEALGVRDRLCITVRLESGVLVLVTQNVKYGERFFEGDLVKVRGTTDVSH